MSLRGAAAIVGIGELPTKRNYPGRSAYSLCIEASKLAIDDAGLRHQDIDGLITSAEDFSPITLAERLGLRPTFLEGSHLMGASGAQSIGLAAMAVNAGLANYVLCAFGGGRDPAFGRGGHGSSANVRTEFENPYGPVVAANGVYALLKQRHMHQFGSTDEQFAKVATDQRFNALTNENAVFHGKPITTGDVLNSPMVCDPLHLLECVMPCAGAFACVVTSAERARALPHPPAFVLGVGSHSTHELIWQSPDITTTPVEVSARKAFEMARYGPGDVQFAELYD